MTKTILNIDPENKCDNENRKYVTKFHNIHWRMKVKIEHTNNCSNAQILIPK